MAEGYHGVAANADEIALLRGMLEIHSLSGEEGRLAAHLRDEMAHRGLHAYVDEAGNAVGEIGETGPTVALLGHMDTAPGVVPVRQEGDLLYGRGSVDAKGPLAAFICAAARLGARAGLRVVVIGAVEEESATSRGARHAAVTHHPDACVIGEPSRWDRVTLGYKGRLLVDYTHSQGSAHTAGAGATASERAVTFWNGLVAVAAEGGGAREFERLTPTLRRIQSGSDGLHDVAHMEISLRLPPDCDTTALRERLRALAGEATLTFSGDEPAYRAPKNTALVRAFLSAIRSEGGAPSFALKTGTSDMNVVGPVWNCPILAYGPGDSALDHTPDEHISLAEYGRAIAVLTASLRQVGP